MEGCAPSSQKSQLYLWVAQEKRKVYKVGWIKKRRKQNKNKNNNNKKQQEKKSTFPQLALSCWPLLCVSFSFSILLPVFFFLLVDSSHLAGSCFYVLVCNQDEQLASPLMGRLNRKHWVGGGEPPPPDDNAILSLYPIHCNDSLGTSMTASFSLFSFSLSPGH